MWRPSAAWPSSPGHVKTILPLDKVPPTVPAPRAPRAPCSPGSPKASEGGVRANQRKLPAGQGVQGPEGSTATRSSLAPASGAAAGAGCDSVKHGLTARPPRDHLHTECREASQGTVGSRTDTGSRWTWGQGLTSVLPPVLASPVATGAALASCKFRETGGRSPARLPAQAPAAYQRPCHPTGMPAWAAHTA